MTETQHRFLKAIAERVDPARVAEVRLYPTVRVGPVESGVAIVAVEMPPGGGTLEEGSAPPQAAHADEPVAVAASALPVAVSEPSRLGILTAHFRLTVKGSDRGKWEFAMVHDADAPVETIESVVRGVARRAGEDGEPELLSGAAYQRAISEPWWTPAT